MQIKVKDIRMQDFPIKNHNDFDSKNIVPVAEAKLVLVPVKNTEAIGLCYRKDTKQWLVHPSTEEDHKQAQYMNPILISETEQVDKETTWVYTKHSHELIDMSFYAGTTVGFRENCSKVLALPEHFSVAHLQMIVGGNLKDGDKVLVECEEINNCTCGRNPLLSQQCDEEQCSSKLEKVIKLTPESIHVSLHLIQPKTYTENEVRELLGKFHMWLAENKREDLTIKGWLEKQQRNKDFGD